MQTDAERAAKSGWDWDGGHKDWVTFEQFVSCSCTKAHYLTTYPWLGCICIRIRICWQWIFFVGNTTRGGEAQCAERTCLAQWRQLVGTSPTGHAHHKHINQGGHSPQLIRRWSELKGKQRSPNRRLRFVVAWRRWKGNVMDGKWAGKVGDEREIGLLGVGVSI